MGFLVLIAGSGRLAVWSFVVLFGAGFGAITPARAALLAEFYGSTRYASIGGALALMLSIARAAAPVGATLLYVAGGGYILSSPLCWLSVYSPRWASFVRTACMPRPAPTSQPRDEFR